MDRLQRHNGGRKRSARIGPVRGVVTWREGTALAMTKTSAHPKFCNDSATTLRPWKLPVLLERPVSKRVVLDKSFHQCCAV